MGSLNDARPPKNPGRGANKKVRGDLDAALARGTVTIDNTYITPLQNHNPMEPHATLAWWDDDKLTVYDSTQYITGDRSTLANTFSSRSKTCTSWTPTSAAASAAKGPPGRTLSSAPWPRKIVQKPVQLALARPQMFGPVGCRPATVNQQIKPRRHTRRQTHRSSSTTPP